MANIEDVIREIQELRKENKTEHGSIFEKLSEHHTDVAVLKTQLSAHKVECGKKHNFLNKVLWMFASVLLLSAGGLILRFIVHG